MNTLMISDGRKLSHEGQRRFCSRCNKKQLRSL
jgi:hypothetical protein